MKLHKETYKFLRTYLGGNSQIIKELSSHVKRDLMRKIRREIKRTYDRSISDGQQMYLLGYIHATFNQHERR